MFFHLQVLLDSQTNICACTDQHNAHPYVNVTQSLPNFPTFLLLKSSSPPLQCVILHTGLSIVYEAISHIECGRVMRGLCSYKGAVVEVGLATVSCIRCMYGAV